MAAESLCNLLHHARPVPLQLLNQIDPAPFSWQVPGLRQELVVALLRSLPKPLRRQLVPLPDQARALLARMTPYQQPLLDALEGELATAGVPVRRADWRLDAVPAHSTVTFQVRDGQHVLAQGKDLTVLARQLQPQLRTTLSAAGAGVQRRGCAAGMSAPCRGPTGTSRLVIWSPPTRRWWTRATRWPSPCCPPSSSSATPCGRAPGGCCSWRCPGWSSRRSAAWTGTPDWCWPATQTATSRPCWPTASPVPPTR